MKFCEIIDGLLDGKSFTYTERDRDDIHFFITIASPINSDNECLCICYFEDIEEDDGEIDPEPHDLQRTDLTTNLWREVVTEDYFPNLSGL